MQKMVIPMVGSVVICLRIGPDKWEMSPWAGLDVLGAQGLGIQFIVMPGAG